jgi:hypothetical protein
MNTSNGIPCKDIYEERAAIMQFDGQMSRYIAELTAAKSQGFNSAVEIKVAFQTEASASARRATRVLVSARCKPREPKVRRPQLTLHMPIQHHTTALAFDRDTTCRSAVRTRPALRD